MWSKIPKRIGRFVGRYYGHADDRRAVSDFGVALRRE
jgi:hypothetical protein